MRGGRKHHIFKFSPAGYLSVFFFWMRSERPFDDPLQRRELADRLTKISGVHFPEAALQGKPKMPMSVIASRPKLDEFLATFQWFVETVRRHAESS